MTAYELENHVVLVTGAGRGIGRAIATTLASSGATLGLLARTEGELRETESMCRSAGGSAIVLTADLTDDGALERALDELRTFAGSPHIVVVNHGIYGDAGAEQGDHAPWDRLLDVNLRASMHLTARVLPAMLSASDSGFRRALVFVSSIAARHHYAGAAGYCASKAGLSAFADVVFEDVREHGIKVVQVLPGYVNTKMADEAAEDVVAERMVQPTDVAQAVRWAVLSPTTCCPVEIVLRPQRSPHRRSS